MAFTQTQVSQLYVSVFGRASEGEGNAFWQAKEGTMASLADEMLASPASIEYFGATLDDNQAFIEFIYNNTLGKTIEEDPDGIAYWVGRLDAGDSKGQIVATMVAALVDGDFTGDADAIAAQDQFNNRVEVSNYCADTIETAEVADLAEFAAYIDGVTDDAATVTAATDAIDDTLVVPFTLAAGLADLAAAQTAVADFNTANPDVAADLATAITAYETAVPAATVATDSEALAAALLSDQQTANATALTTAQDALADALEDVDEVAGLTAAVAADEAADEAVVESAAAAVVAQTALEVAAASWILNSDAGEFTDGSVSTGGVGAHTGVFTVVVDESVSDGTAFADNDVLTLTEIDADGFSVLKDADDAWTADQVEFFEAQQAGAADVIAAFNADVVADTTAAADVTAAAATQATVDFLDVPATALDELALVGTGFTLTDAAITASPTEAEIAAETAALVAVAAGTQAVVDGATEADTAADLLVTNYTNAQVDAVAANATADDSGDATDDLVAIKAAFASATGVTEADIATVNATTTDALALTAIDDLLTAYTAAAVDTNTVLTDATTADDAADLAVTTFAGLVTDFGVANATNPLTAGLGGLETAVTAAEDAITALADAVADLTAAQADDDALTALTDAVTDAVTAITDEGYATPEDLDAASEFGTAADDIFIAGTTDSSIYSFDLIGSDTLYVGTAAAYNDTLIGAGTGETLLTEAGDVAALEMFLVTSGSDVNVVIETENYGSETGDYTTITLKGVDIDDVSVADGFITIA